MHLIDYLLLLAVGFLLGAAIHFVRKGRSCCSAGGCSGCCGSCSGCSKSTHR